MQAGWRRSACAQLAEMLDVAPMALYRHVANKDDLIDGMVDVVFGEIGLPSGGGDWRTAMRRRAISVRDVLARHRWAIGLMESRTTPGSGEPAPPRRGDRQAPRGRLRHGDGRPRVLAAGQLHLRLRADEDEPARSSAAEDVAEVAETMLEPFPANEYPNLVEFITEHAMQPGYDYGDEFEYGLDLVLDGLEQARLARGTVWSGPASGPWARGPPS